MQNSIYISNITDPYRNLAMEEMLFDAFTSGCSLYLWQNQNTVVIGKNQNAWKECRISLLEQEGGRLARRSSGGGAVFHDLGNLNFTFILPRKQYDVARQLSVVQRAVAAFGIQADFSGRNDLVERSTGAKFSGNAFRLADTVAMHHGTVLVDVDMQKLSRYLAPSQDKLQAKGVESVRARVVNLSELAPALTIAGLQQALQEAFVEVYGPAGAGVEAALDAAELERRTLHYASWEWRMGHTPRFDITLERRFPWGGLELALSLKNGYVQEAAAYSDAMDEAFVGRIAPAITGCAFRSADLAACMQGLGGEQAAELAAWVREKGF